MALAVLVLAVLPPDDLSGWGYCTVCCSIHERDADGDLCDAIKPLPTAMIAPGIGRLRWLWQALIRAFSRR